MPASRTNHPLSRVRRLGEKGFLIRDRLIIYIDPVGLPAAEELPIADIVLLTCAERCSQPDVMRVSRPQTVVAGPIDCVWRFPLNQLAMRPGQAETVLGLEVSAAEDGRGFVLDLENGKVRILSDAEEAQ